MDEIYKDRNIEIAEWEQHKEGLLAELENSYAT